MAEAFSSEGVPVFLVDVKGDLSGIAQAGANSGKSGRSIAEFELGEQWLQKFPRALLGCLRRNRYSVRVTVSEMGPMLLARLMNLNDTQEGLLNLVFKVADDRGWHILDLKDLRSMLKHVSDHASEYRTLIRQRLRRQYRCNSTPTADFGKRRCRKILRRTFPQPARLDANRQRQRHHQHPQLRKN